jgi:hypothetical protein
MDFHVKLVEAHGQLEYSLAQTTMHSHVIGLTHFIFNVFIIY